MCLIRKIVAFFVCSLIASLNGFSDTVANEDNYYYISANGNNLLSVERELNSEAVKRVLVSGVKQYSPSSINVRIASDESDPVLTAKITVTGSSETILQQALGRCAAYVRLRLSGHTKTYSVAALRDNAPDDPREWKDVIRRAQNNGGAGLSHYKGKIIALPEIGAADFVYRSLDGDLSWIYVKSGEFLRVYRIDSVEFSAQKRKRLDAVADAAWKETLLQHQSAPLPFFWAMLQKGAAEVGVIWRSPIQLNPEIVFD